MSTGPRRRTVYRSAQHVRCIAPNCGHSLRRTTLRPGEFMLTCDARVRRPGLQETMRCGQHLFLIAVPGGRIAVVEIRPEEWASVEQDGDAGTAALWDLGIYEAAYSALARAGAA